MPTPNGSFIMLEIDVLSTNVPMLLGLDVLCKFGLRADTVRNVLHRTAEDWDFTTGMQSWARVPPMFRYKSNFFHETQSCRNCIAIFRIHRQKNFSHCSSIQKLTI
jgi:hypothetical protein